MTDATNGVQKSSAEFDFALAGHANTRLSESPSVKLVHGLRLVKQEIAVVQPGELVSQFVSSGYIESKSPAQVVEIEVDLDQNELSVLDTVDRDEIIQDPPADPLDFGITVETEISKSDLARPKSALFVDPPDVLSEPRLSSFDPVDNGVTPFPHAVENEPRPNIVFEGDAANTNLPEPLPVESPDLGDDEVLLIPRDEISSIEIAKDPDSLIFFDQRSLLVPREGDLRVGAPASFGVDSAPDSFREPFVVNRVDSLGTPSAQPPPEPPQAVRLPIVPTLPTVPSRIQPSAKSVSAKPSLLRTESVEGSIEVAKTVRHEERTTSFDSKLVLLLVGLVTLVAFVILCIWLIISIGADTGSGAASRNVDVAEFVPSEDLATVPAVIQAEDYDIGGTGVSFNDSDDQNTGEVYRFDGVDIAAAPNGQLKLAVVDTDEGEWLVYTFTVTERGTFVVSTGVSPSIDEPGSIDVSVDGNRIGTFYGETSPDEFDFTKQVVGEVEIGPGEHQLRLDWSGNGGISVDWLEIGRA